MGGGGEEVVSRWRLEVWVVVVDVIGRKVGGVEFVG